MTIVNANTLRFEVPGAAGGGIPIRAGFKRVVFRFGMWQDRSQDLEIVAMPGMTVSGGSSSSASPMPVSAGVHVMEIIPDSAGPGQTVTATLLDGSLDLDTICTAARKRG